MKRISLSSAKVKEISDILTEFDSYSKFISSYYRSDAYKVASLYGVNVCPYCNINYTYTMYDAENFVARPDFDHYHQKSDENELNVYNLVPSCQQCNSRVKHIKPFHQRTHLHPFFNDYDEACIFEVKLKENEIDYKNGNCIEITIEKRKGVKRGLFRRAKRLSDDLKINIRYSYHRNVAAELFQRCSFYDPNKIAEIDSLLGTKGACRALLLPDESCDINNTSLGKLKRDVSAQVARAFGL